MLANLLVPLSRALFMPVVLFLSAPQSILEMNKIDFPNNLSVSYHFYILFIIFSVICILAVFMERRLKYAGIFLTVLCFITFISLIFHLLQTFSNQYPIWSQVTLDIFAIVLALLFFFRLDRKSSNSIIAAVSAVFIVHTAIGQFGLYQEYLTRNLDRTAPSDSPSRHESRTRASSPLSNDVHGNVYHIVLDGFQSDAFQYLLKRGEIAALESFTYFSNFKSSYWRTHFSMSSIILGEYYDGRENIMKWTYRSFDERGLFRDLHENSIPIIMYPYYKYYCPSFAATCDSQVVHAAGESGRQALTDLWFQSIIPPSLRTVLNSSASESKNEIRGHERSLGFSVTSFLGLEPVVPLHLHPIHSIHAFDRLLEEEENRPARGQYLFFHAILPHGPYLYGPNCELRDDFGDDLARYYAQAKCGINIVKRLVAELKRRGRFDNSLIIVHADHGIQLVKKKGKLIFERDARVAGLIGRFNRDTDPTSKWPQEVINATANALLLVKFPKSDDTFNVCRNPVGALEIVPTILQSFGIDPAPYAGVLLQDVLRGRASAIVSHFTNDMVVHHSIPDHFSEYRLEEMMWRYQRMIVVSGQAN